MWYAIIDSIIVVVIIIIWVETTMEATATTIDTAAAAAEPLTVVRNYQERTGLTLVKYQIWITSYNGYNGSDSLTPLSYNRSLLHNLVK